MREFYTDNPDLKYAVVRANTIFVNDEPYLKFDGSHRVFLFLNKAGWRFHEYYNSEGMIYTKLIPNARR